MVIYPKGGYELDLLMKVLRMELVTRIKVALAVAPDEEASEVALPEKTRGMEAKEGFLKEFSKKSMGSDGLNSGISGPFGESTSSGVETYQVHLGMP
ncbi:hypothetical protein ACH5RR_009029 [Cinchona calisaya]|uniref:Uncharacterized protein n=1 Tax=Cinchona calisaya TaxID=153742 RepID=A0ABD3ADA1_9GENT